MSLQFSRSIRSMNADSYRVARIGMIGMLLVISALLAWFFLAKVSLYVQSSSIRLTDNQRILATFSNESFTQVRPGQTAILRLQEQTGAQSPAFSLVVFSVEKENNRAEILLVNDVLPADLSPGDLKGELSVEIARVTPFSFVLKASGFEGKQPGAPSNPSSNKAGTP